MDKITKIQQDLLKLLESKNENVVLQCIEQLRDQGGDFAIIPLMEKYFSSDSDNVRDKIGKLFSDTKFKKIGTLVSENILNYKNSIYLKDFLVFIWESTIIFNDLSSFTTLLLSNNINVAIESSSIIEENIDNISPKNKNKCLQIINNGLINIKSDFQKQLIELTQQTLETK